MDPLDHLQLQEEFLETLLLDRHRPVPLVPSALFCQSCGDPIPESRRELLPGVQLCTCCQQHREERDRRLRPH